MASRSLGWFSRRARDHSAAFVHFVKSSVSGGFCSLGGSVVAVGPGGKQVQMHCVVKNPAAEARVLKVNFSAPLIGAELNGVRVQFTGEKGKPSAVAVKLAAGESGLLSLTSEAGGTATFDWGGDQPATAPAGQK